MSEPVTVAEFQDFARVSSTTEDEVIELCLLAARGKFEDETDRALVPKTITLSLDRFPRDGRRFIELPGAPVRSIASVTYQDAAGDTQTMSASDYALVGGFSVSGQAPRLALATAADWPGDVACIPGAVTVTYAAGYAAPGDVPRMSKLGVLWLASWYYEQRLHVNIGNIFGVLPDHLQSVIWAQKSIRRYVEDVAAIVPTELMSAAMSEVINLPQVTGLTGGGLTNLDGLDSATYGVGAVVILTFGDAAQWWKLRARGLGEVEDGASLVAPDDDTADALIWVKIQ